MATQTFTIHTENSEQTNALKAFVKALKMKFEISKFETDNTGIYGLTDEHQLIVEQRIARHLSGESKSHSWEEVKANARKALQDKKSK